MGIYALNRKDLDAIKDVEIAFGTTKLLPPFENIPEEFKKGNIYSATVDALFAGAPLPDAELKFRPKFDDPEAPAALVRCVRAHLRSWEPKHEHKIAGVAYMASLVCEIEALPGKEPASERKAHAEEQTTAKHSVP